jgi:hypothetical protein
MTAEQDRDYAAAAAEVGRHLARRVALRLAELCYRQQVEAAFAVLNRWHRWAEAGPVEPTYRAVVRLELLSRLNDMRAVMVAMHHGLTVRAMMEDRR